MRLIAFDITNKQLQDFKKYIPFKLSLKYLFDYNVGTRDIHQTSEVDRRLINLQRNWQINFNVVCTEF